MKHGTNAMNEELIGKAELLHEEAKHLAFILLNNCEKRYSWWEQHKEITTVLDKYAREEDFHYFDPLVDLAGKLLGDYYREVFRYILTHAIDYPYSKGYYRRPFRTSNRACHKERILDKILTLFHLFTKNFSLSAYLTEADYEIDSSIISHIIAFEIDKGNDEVMQALKQIIYGDNNTALLTVSMIRGMFLSHSQEAYHIMGELLIAARLQEGLRQSIVENMDEGTIEASIYLLQIILENDLIRYSSVVRALAVWTGIPFESVHTRIVKQCIQYAYSCLTDETIREQWLHSSDVNQMYFSLWATSVFEENRLYPQIQHLMQNGELYQKIVAQYFLTQSQNDELKYHLSQQYLEESDLELRYWIIENYNYSYSFSWEDHRERTISIYRLSHLENKEERDRQFHLLKKMLQGMAKKEISFSSKVYEWSHITFSTDQIAKKMMYITAYDFDLDRIAELIAMKDLISPDTRDDLLTFFTNDHDNPVQREFILSSLSDKSTRIRETALAKLKKRSLTEREIQALEDVLSLKSGSLRQSAIKLLLGVTSKELEDSIDRLIQSKNEFQRLAALEIISELKENEEQSEKFERLTRKIAALEFSTEKEKILLAKLFEKEEFNAKNGFGLFDPKIEHLVRAPQKHVEDFQIQEVFALSVDPMKEFLNGLADLVHIHREHEYEVEWYNGHKETYLVGSNLQKINLHRLDPGQKRIERYPLSEVWSAYLEGCSLRAADLLQLVFYLHGNEIKEFYTKDYDYLDIQKNKWLVEWVNTFLTETYPLDKIDEMGKWSSDYYTQVRSIVHAFFRDGDQSEIFDIAIQVLAKIVNTLPVEECKGNGRLLRFLAEPWLQWAGENIHDDHAFEDYFQLKYQLYALGNYEHFFDLSTEEFCRAYRLNIIDENLFYQELMIRDRGRHHLYRLTTPKNNIVNEYPEIMPLRNRLVERVLEIELNRGDLPTDVTPLAMQIKYIEGMDTFIQILVGLDQESFVRGYIYGYGDSITKKETFSHLLKVCHPKEGEDEGLLREKLKGKNISETRLLDAAMYAPQWLDLIAKYLQWDGLRSAAWYFHAHINESFSAEKETIVAHYSPISPEDFNNGAFDIQWFKDAYHELGEKRFSVLYKCARYISGGANHRRSQLFADATLGKLKLDEMKQSAATKRNKDHLLCYSLIPIETKNERDVLERYEFIQKFLKESKKFGAQRRASESQTATISLENLARNAGYKDVTRLKWDMEAMKIDDILLYLEPTTIDDLIIQLVIDADGQGTIKVSKNNKELKSVPAKYNKHEHVVALKEIRAELKDQYSRAKMELERSMEMKSTFTLQELTNLVQNPVIAPLLTKLVLKIDDNFGYFTNGVLVGVGGKQYNIQANDEAVIAHPVDLYENGCWSDFQRDLFTRQIKQPFKQVFRELYLPNEDELASGTLSRRYAGHQVQPRKTVALLKNRMWTVSYEEGLQKVYHHENIIARIYALADWYSPSEVESPTIETVEFFDRHSYQSLTLKAIPKHIFSEIMRDVDLVVSVAHVGGVDPEASLTTIEMRKAIVQESLRLMKVINVRMEGNFAHIAGNLGEYSVHLGSGMVYKQATGALSIIPVHAQHRGRIFLPFMDEDPKTSEILSKIIMLAQDNKIKDPYILSQIKS